MKTQPEGEIFGRRLRELRMERGLTQDALSQIVATSKPPIAVDTMLAIHSSGAARTS